MEKIPTGRFEGGAVGDLSPADLRELGTTTRFHLPPELCREIEIERMRRRLRRRRVFARRAKNSAWGWKFLAPRATTAASPKAVLKTKRAAAGRVGRVMASAHVSKHPLAGPMCARVPATR